jgi:hypothetical protein
MHLTVFTRTLLAWVEFWYAFQSDESERSKTLNDFSLTNSNFTHVYRVPPKETQWVLLEIFCVKPLSAMHLMTSWDYFGATSLSLESKSQPKNSRNLMTSRRRIRIILTELFSVEHGSGFRNSLRDKMVANSTKKHAGKARYPFKKTKSIIPTTSWKT